MHKTEYHPRSRSGLIRLGSGLISRSPPQSHGGRRLMVSRGQARLTTHLLTCSCLSFIFQKIDPSTAFKICITHFSLKICCKKVWNLLKRRTLVHALSCLASFASTLIYFCIVLLDVSCVANEDWLTDNRAHCGHKKWDARRGQVRTASRFESAVPLTRTHLFVFYKMDQ
jgi:hypothetical protein